MEGFKLLYKVINPFLGKYLNFYKPNELKDIFIFAVPRSGSTLLMEIIYSQPKIIYINEPFHPNHLKMNKNPKIENCLYKDIYNGNIHPTTFLEIIKKIQNRQSFIGYPTKFYSKKYCFYPRRRVFKILERIDLINYIEANLDINIIHLIRHPIPTALSWYKNRYPFNASFLLRNKDYCSNNLERDLIIFSKKIVQKGSEFDKYILFWCLENKPALDNPDRNNRLLITYEEMVKFPLKVINYISNKLNLPNKRRMQKTIFNPSSAIKMSDKQTKNYFKNKNHYVDRDFLIKKWVYQVNSDLIESTFSILEKFNIEIYKKGKYMPIRRMF